MACPGRGLSSPLGIEETAVALLKDTSFDARMRSIRGSGRLNSRVAVAVEWTDADRSLRAEGYTIDIGAKGCLAVVPQEFGVGQKLRLVNLTNQISCEAVLVWRRPAKPARGAHRPGWPEPSPSLWGLGLYRACARPTPC